VRIMWPTNASASSVTVLRPWSSQPQARCSQLALLTTATWTLAESGIQCSIPLTELEL
jgi:hypothetical protein